MVDEFITNEDFTNWDDKEDDWNIKNNIIALIPARSGSKRIPNKNIKILGEHPLLAYAIQSALDSEIFDGVYVSSDSYRIGKIAKYYGAKFIPRPISISEDNSPDSEWINNAKEQIEFDYFAIVRPTNPFRTGETIKRAYLEWDKLTPLKSIEPIKQHPKKAWIAEKYMYAPYSPNRDHLKPTQTFQKLFYQNGCIEFRTFDPNIRYQAFYTKDYEGFDLNTVEDWILAEALIEKGYAKLPEIKRKPYDFTTV